LVKITTTHREIEERCSLHLSYFFAIINNNQSKGSMTKIKKTKLSFEEIYKRLDLRELVIVHTKDEMKPLLLHANDNQLYEMPEGYLVYDSRFYYKKI
jgi:hypothetical protein